MSEITLGIIGGGQLGKMLLQYVSRLSLTTHVYDQSEATIALKTRSAVQTDHATIYRSY